MRKNFAFGFCKVVPLIPSKELRESSYAGIIYIDLRCGLVHQYRLPLYMKGFRHTQQADVPSYFNMVVDPDPATVKRVASEYGISEQQASVAIARINRHLHMPYQYVRDTLLLVANSVFDYWDNAKSWTRPQPPTWWIQG